MDQLEPTPELTEPTDAPRPNTFDHVPDLRELLPKTGGIPGVLYAQVSISNARKAQDEGWGDMHGNLAIYTITGPSGTVDCKLVCKGKPIPGQGSGSGARVCLADDTIYQLTGIPQPNDGSDTRQEVMPSQPAKRGPGRPKKITTEE